MAADIVSTLLKTLTNGGGGSAQTTVWDLIWGIIMLVVLGTLCYFIIITAPTSNKNVTENFRR